VPVFPVEFADSAPYDWRTLLTPVFDFESPKQALEWSKLAIVETISDLGVAPSEVARRRDATAQPPEDTYECLEVMTQALVDSTAVWSYARCVCHACAIFCFKNYAACAYV
jgi:hypothetical protein